MFSFVLAVAQAVLTVFAAASLHAAFPELGKSFEALHPRLEVRFDFNGSQILEAQLVQGAEADVFASADRRWMDKASRDGVVGASVPFAYNSLVVVAGSSSGVARLADLTKPGVRLVLCADAAPCGRYTRATLEKMDADAAFGKGFASAVARNVVSEEEDVEAVLAKIELGEADAGIVYRSDVAQMTKHLRVIEPPSADQPEIVYPIAVVRASKSPSLAADFISFVRSPQGHEILRRYGLVPAP